MPLTYDIPCVILAGGKSSRMGKQKALLPFEETNLLSYGYEKMCKIFQDVFISCREDVAIGFEKVALIDKEEIFSPLVGIKNAFLGLQSQKIFFLSVDTPFVKPKTIRRLYEIRGEYDLIYPKSGDRCHYLVGIWDRNVFEILNTALFLKQYKIVDLVDKIHTYELECDDEREFYNLNTPQDYQNALKYLKEENA